MDLDGEMRRDQFAALIVAERDAALREAGPLEVVGWPDMDDRRRPAVDFVARDAQGLVAVEHTVIESYSSQIAERKALQMMFPLGGPELLELANAPQFQVIVRVDDLLAIPRLDRPLLEPAMAAWVRRMLPEVPWPHVPGQPSFVRGHLDRPRLEVSLERWIADVGFVGPLARVVPVRFWRPADLEDRRRHRLREALDRKLPKLLAAEPQARTILVLEDRDMHMSAPGFVSRALAAEAGEHLPDVIYLLNVTAGDPLLTPIYMSGAWWHEDDRGLLVFPAARAARFHELAP